MLNTVFYWGGGGGGYKVLNDIKHHVLSSRYSPCVQFNFTCWKLFELSNGVAEGFTLDTRLLSRFRLRDLHQTHNEIIII